MGMSSEDFGAVLGELTAPTPLADALEIRYPKNKSDRWWFSIRMCCAGFFVSKPVQVDACDKQNKYLLDAGKAWHEMERPEMYLWIVEALGLEDKAKDLSEKMHARLDTGDCTVPELVEIAKKLIVWEDVENAACAEHARLVAKSALPHRNC